MFGSQVLEVAIGLVLVYLLLSLICSSIREGIEAWQKTRAEYEPAKIAKDRMPSRNNLPSYIPAKNFAVALMDIVARGPSFPPAAAREGGAVGGQGTPPAATRVSLESLRSAVGKLCNTAVQRALLTAIDTAQGDLGRAQSNALRQMRLSLGRRVEAKGPAPLPVGPLPAEPVGRGA
jgi:hypothetical protein